MDMSIFQNVCVFRVFLETPLFVEYLEVLFFPRLLRAPQAGNSWESQPLSGHLEVLTVTQKPKGNLG